MGKLIAVWGSPGSGKTTFSVKLAEALYNRSRGKSAVIVVFTDIVTPTIPVIFPNFRCVTVCIPVFYKSETAIRVYKSSAFTVRFHITIFGESGNHILYRGVRTFLGHGVPTHYCDGRSVVDLNTIPGSHDPFSTRIHGRTVISARRNHR